jgi:histidinol phosphatase-like PHP family hydrolase
MYINRREIKEFFREAAIIANIHVLIYCDYYLLYYYSEYQASIQKVLGSIKTP